MSDQSRFVYNFHLSITLTVHRIGFVVLYNNKNSIPVTFIKEGTVLPWDVDIRCAGGITSLLLT